MSAYCDRCGEDHDMREYCRDCGAEMCGDCMSELELQTGLCRKCRRRTAADEVFGHPDDPRAAWRKSLTTESTGEFMTIPGAAAKHAIITDECRTNKGDDAVIEEALGRLRDEWRNVSKGWPIGAGGKFHVVLVVERPAGTLPTLPAAPENITVRENEDFARDAKTGQRK